MKKTYTSPKLERITIDANDVIQTSGVTNIDTSGYGFKTTADHTNQGQSWLPQWNDAE